MDFFFARQCRQLRAELLAWRDDVAVVCATLLATPFADGLTGNAPLSAFPVELRPSAYRSERVAPVEP